MNEGPEGGRSQVIDNIFEAIETGEFSPPLVKRLTKLDAELD